MKRDITQLVINYTAWRESSACRSKWGGKSSLASLIPRFYDVSEGTVYVDGIDVRKYNMRNLRSHIGIVLQDNLLFSDTIGANILYGNPKATEKEVIVLKARKFMILL